MGEQETVYEPSQVRERPEYKTRILELIRTTVSPKVLRESLERFHASDIADTLTELNEEERKKFFKLLDTEQLADVLEYVDEQEQAAYLDEMNIKKLISIIGKMEPDKAADILRKMSRYKREIVLELLDGQTRRDISLIISYEDDQIGSQMTTNFIEIPQGSTVKQAMRALKRQARDSDNISMIYVTDENGMYYGAIRLKDLFVARANTDLKDIIETNYPFVYATEETDDALEDLRDYNEDSVPVLNNENQILGVITSQDLLEVFDEDRANDYVRFAGLSAQEDLNETLGQSLKKRVPWLIMLLGLGLIVSSVIGLFEGVVAQLTIAMVFQSLILDMSGNVGTQSLSVAIRVLTDPDLKWKQKLYLVWKEVRVGFVNGLLIGVGSALALGLYIKLTTAYGWGDAYAIAACIGVSMVVSMVISSFTGSVIPVLFKAANIDPAAASGPLITTLNDLTGVITYYSLCWVFLIQMLHL